MQYAQAFSAVDERGFRALLMQVRPLPRGRIPATQRRPNARHRRAWWAELPPAQDYGKFGVTKMEDKQKLFRLIKSINSDKRASKPPAVERASPARDAYGGA